MEVSVMKRGMYLIIVFIVFAAPFIYAQGDVSSSLQGGIEEFKRGYDEWNAERFDRAAEIFDGLRAPPTITSPTTGRGSPSFT